MGPDSSGWARKLILTVSFFKGTVEVLTEGFSGSVSLMPWLRAYLAR
jgi:hypothetical protein